MPEEKTPSPLKLAEILTLENSDKKNEDEKSTESPESKDSSSPTSSAKIDALAVQTITSTQKEEVASYRKIEDKTGKVSWSNTHFVFVLDCSG